MNTLKALSLALGEFSRLLVVETGPGDGFLEDRGVRVYAAALDYAAQSTIPGVITRERIYPYAPPDLRQPPQPLVYSSLPRTLPTAGGTPGSYAKVYTG